MLGTLAQAASDFTTTTTTTTITESEATAILGVGAGVLFVAVLVFYLVSALITSFVFKKASKPMWAAYVPVYNSWVLFEISGKPGWWVLVNFIPFVGALLFLALYIVAMLELSKRFGYGVLFAIIGLILFPIIGFAMLAFGKAQYAAAGGGTPGEFTPQQPQPVDTVPQTSPVSEDVQAAVPQSQFQSASAVVPTTAPSQDTQDTSVSPQAPVAAEVQDDAQDAQSQNPPANPVA